MIARARKSGWPNSGATPTAVDLDPGGCLGDDRVRRTGDRAEHRIRLPPLGRPAHRQQLPIRRRLRPLRPCQPGVSCTASGSGTSARSSPRTPTAPISHRSCRPGRGSNLAGHPTDATSRSSPRTAHGLAVRRPDRSRWLALRPVRQSRPEAESRDACAWSPDGSRLACEGWDDTDLSRNGIYTVRSSDGGDLARVTTSPDGAHDIPTDYSPDGRQIVFVRGKPGDEANSTLMVVNVDGSGARALSDQNLRWGRWSPDGKTILSGAGVEAEKLLLVPIDGGEIRTIEILSDHSLEDRVFRELVPRWRVDRLLRQDLERCRSLHRAGGRHATSTK